MVAFRQLTESIGAEVIGLDMRRPIDDAMRAELRDAFEKYNLLLVRDVEIDAARQAEYGEIFGSIVLRKGIKTEAEPEEKTQYISNSRNDGILGNGELVYHQDHLFHENPLLGLILYAIEVPASGSATKFRSCAGIYDALGDEEKARAERIRCLHLYDYTAASYDNFTLEKAAPGSPRAWQPLVWRHPATGQRAVWAVHETTVAFEGADEQEGWAMLDLIQRRANDVEEYVHAWRPGDLLLWNNRMLQHARTPFDPAERRTLRRTPLI